MATFQILGSVIDSKTSGQVSGLRVEAWDKDLIINDLVGSAVTDERGNFHIEFDESYFQELFADRQPDLFFRIFRDNQLLKSTEDSVLWQVAPGQTQVLIEIELYNQENLYNKFLQAAAGGVEDHPVLLYYGIQKSPYQEQIRDYPSRLKQKPDGKTVVSTPQADARFSDYPALGQVPEIDEQGLEFLHEEIKEACVCISSFTEGGIKTKWLGRNALSNQEFWSGSKIIPPLYMACQINAKSAAININNCNIRGADEAGTQRDIPVIDLVREVVSYAESIATSNSLAAMFKRFAPQIELENWLKSITGNHSLIFRGRYGEKPFIEQPELVDRTTQQTILTADPQPPEWGNNTISAYDLNRLISMLGWHNSLPDTSRLPNAQWHNLEAIITALGSDPARLVDLAIAELGLQNAIDSMVIISKLGNGATQFRNRTEAVYIALVQFVKLNLQDASQPAQQIAISMALRGAKVLEPRDLDQEVVELDAGMAAEVTEIVRRAVMKEWK
ncbi:MAG TPA: hypothetical protein DDZ80_21630 [Cyanobacteria bacterium UBA8803]|nr:hypothetical protein [Cyanobacteria bacterium UBA9273]HBL60936.1 hypothetical protein [Cyanobacteria bacterium UBA8803]